jgi:ParB family chromosome partitioning protein
MKLETLQLNNLNPADYNPRTISKDEFEGLKTSLKTFGQQENLIVNKDMTIISGHQRYNAMKALGWTEAVCNLVDLDKHEEKKLNVIMNSTAISGKYDDLKLSEILEELKLDDDYTSLRLNALEPLDLSPTEVEEDEAPEVSQDPPVSKLGEIYQLGRHRVMCGDSTDKLAVEVLMDGVKADLVLTDPPYNIASDSSNFASDVSKAMKDLSESEWDKGFDTMTVVPILQDIANENSTTYIFTSHFLFGELFEQYKDWADFTNYNVWSKPNPMPSLAKRHWTWSSELCLYATKGKQVFNFINGEHNLSVWSVTKKSDGSHPTQKPIELLANIVQHSSNKEQLVADLFLGSGSTLIACEQTDRTCYGMELDPKYVDVIRKRYWKLTHYGNEEGWEDGTTN